MNMTDGARLFKRIENMYEIHANDTETKYWYGQYINWIDLKDYKTLNHFYQ